MIRELKRCVIVGGSGGVGSMFATLLAKSGVEVCIIDITPLTTEFQFEKCDITAPTPHAISFIEKADMVMLALPENIALQAVAIVGEKMKKAALLVHTLSVQVPIATKIGVLEMPLEVVGLNPMFAPNLSIVGRPVAVIVQNSGPRADKLIQLLLTWGGSVVQLDAEEHDQLVAAMQALTHAAVFAFGLALADLDVDIVKMSSLAPPPHATLLALLARISSGTPEVYWDIQSANLQASTARITLLRAVDRLSAAMKDKYAFIDVMHEAREVLGNELTLYQELCSHIFNESLGQFNRTLQEEKL
ncbi:prephenate dehydrogenase dimerization domain-containing protein [Bacillus cereus group sp. BfR-BA-01383]|uniref:prephenate dehydrogenase dimerization domain-containing protein n=1 Tax=Bacillus cereus group sp. BfR-BA-01383 TaxID=2920327 RepID=UPI001F591DEE|nr:prephenate dehydrogenase dimerization domain-containing protein [Bacillus cereus group sp. BfR-BA-01383]